jgi:peptide/nickel transport system permease protein
MSMPTTDATTLAAAESGDAGSAAPVTNKRGKRKRFRFLANGKSATGLGMVLFFVILGIVGPWVAPQDPSKLTRDRVKPPSLHHIFGTTHLGQDIFSQVLVGARVVMFVGFTAGVVATALSVLVGVTSGYLGGWIDDILSALTNVFLVIPALLLIIIITATIPDAGDVLVALVIGCTSWAWGARVLRAQTLSLRRRDYVQAARATGETSWRIIIFEILPNLTAIIAAGFVGTVIFAVTSEITLAFIGVAGSSGWNWGTILFWAQSQQALAQGAWWWFVPAGLAIALLGTGLSLLNFGIDEFISPRLRSAGRTKLKMANGRKVRLRVGFTPVLDTLVANAQSKDSAR